MKKSFKQIAQNIIEKHRLSDLDCRPVLHWFGESSLYFPTEQEKNKAQSAFIWLYQNILLADNAIYNPVSRDNCIDSFSTEFSLSRNSSENMINSFINNSMATNPIIIGIEGLDGSGKTVQAKKLSDVLMQRGMKVCVIDFPQYTSFFGKEIGALLSNKNTISAMDLDEKSMCLWYGLDRWKAINHAQLRKYDYVIFNRYTLSSVVYQSARKYGGLNREFADWIFELEHKQLMLPVPDIYFYLDTGSEHSGQNVLRKGVREYVDGLDVYEKSLDLLSCCRNIYKELSDDIFEMIFLECTDINGTFMSVEKINAKIMAVLDEYGLLL